MKKQIVLWSKELKDAQGTVIGIVRSEITLASTKELLKDELTDIAKQLRLKDLGYSAGEIQIIKSEGYFNA